MPRSAWRKCLHAPASRLPSAVGGHSRRGPACWAGRALHLVEPVLRGTPPLPSHKGEGGCRRLRIPPPCGEGKGGGCLARHPTDTNSPQVLTPVARFSLGRG